MRALENKKIENHPSSPFFGKKIQTKIKTGQPGDKYEIEADRVADKVVNKKMNSSNGLLQTKKEEEIQKKSISNSITPLQKKEMKEEEPVQKKEEEDTVQKKEMKEEEPVQKKEEEEKPVQAKSNNTSPEIQNNKVENNLSNSKSGGNQMDKNIKKEMESGFGADFSNVRIHTDTNAVNMSQELGAQAFTHKNDIYFNQGKYNPESREGKHLLAHELTHTIQQEGMIPDKLQFTIGDGNDLQSTRFSGDAVLEACLDSEQQLSNGSTGAPVALVQQALIDAGFPLPRFGADGIFGNETKSALQNFQRASSLNADGIVNSNTMSALDSLYTKGVPQPAPAIPVNPAPTVPPTITTETIKSAPDGTPDTRTTIGVGERVRLTANTAGTWTVSEGHIIGLNNGASIIWEAPGIAANPTITLTTPSGTKVTPFTVIAPNGLSMVVAANDAIPTGTAGACMITDVTVNPLNVNLGRTQWLEIPGPATNVAGYFNQFPAATIFHNPNPNFLPFNDNNTGLNDHAAWEAVPPPFSLGTFEWVIPNHYRLDGESGQGRLFTNTVQAFFMMPSGTMMITKAGASVIRTINNLVI
ncbi:eCIS core domain-containing protein [Flavobacterium adhaerens]|uniref:eCIS core domain-containing protein n=1 Tax=Flavobacterium adhaerens TaxID=3149043 RepID=UPI0032B56862